MHDSEEYGVLRFPLKEIAGMIGCPLSHMRELADKGVLTGSDGAFEGYTYTPTYAGKKGAPVVLVPACDGPVWFSRRMVRDEWRRHQQGASTRFGPGGKHPESDSPTRRDGERQGAPPTARQGRGAMVLGSVSIHGVVDGNADARGRQPENRSGEISPLKANPRQGQRWWKSEAGITAHGRELGIPAKRGESIAAYKDRLFAAERKGHSAQ
jgi:hypothetical protein